MAESHYIHGTDEAERARLSRLNELLNRRSLAALRLRGGERILDVGSGLGQLSLAMLHAGGPGARVLGIERSEVQREQALRLASTSSAGDRIEFRAGDALALPLRKEEWGSFDVVHTRFLLEHVPQPLAVVQQMVRAARVGGRIVLEDDDHELLRLWPRCREIDALWEAYQRSYVEAGNDPIVGRRLVELLQHAGAAPLRNDWLFFGACSGQPEFPDFVANLHGVLEGARAAICRTGLVDADAVARALAALARWAQRPDAALWYCTAWAEGVAGSGTTA
jgi:SAM-dependent methyltransferase